MSIQPWDIHGEILTAPINISTSGDNIIIPAISDGYIYILGLEGTPAADVVLQLKSGSTVLRNFSLKASQPINEGTPDGHYGAPAFKCPPNQAFIINLSLATSFTGGITYAYRT